MSHDVVVAAAIGGLSLFAVAYFVGFDKIQYSIKRASFGLFQNWIDYKLFMTRARAVWILNYYRNAMTQVANEYYEDDKSVFELDDDPFN